MKFLIDMGHCIQGADTGARGCGYKEEELTREIGNNVINQLRLLGHEAVVCSCDTSNNLNDSLSYRVNKANSEGGDIFVSIHLNAFNGEAYGTEIYTYNGRDFSEAREILNNIVGLGYTNRYIKDGSSLYVIKNTSMKALLIECCFIDNKNDMERFNSCNIANAIVKGLTGKSSIKPVEQKPQGDDWIKRLQAECNRQGFSNQTIDGFAGKNTLNGCPLMRYGATGNITRLLQERLNLYGYSTNGIDGIFGGGTKEAVMKYQRNNGLSDDGIVGYNTWKKILGL